jgi:hypothetical protein
MSLHFFEIVSFEIPITRPMKSDQDRHDFAQTQTALTLAQARLRRQERGLQDRFKGLFLMSNSRLLHQPCPGRIIQAASGTQHIQIDTTTESRLRRIRN